MPDSTDHETTHTNASVQARDGTKEDRVADTVHAQRPAGDGMQGFAAAEVVCMPRQRQAWTHSNSGVVLGLALGYDPPALPKERSPWPCSSQCDTLDPWMVPRELRCSSDGGDFSISSSAHRAFQV